MFIEAVPLGYDAAKEGVKNTLFNLHGEFGFYIIQQANMDLLLMKKIQALTQSDLFMDALT